MPTRAQRIHKLEILRRQKEEEDFWDEHEDPRLESSSDESNCDESSQDESSSAEEDLVIENKRGDSTCEGLGDDDGGVQLESGERTFKPTWREDAGGYLRGVRGCGSSATDKRERRRKKELEKSASQTKSIVAMFSAQFDKNRSSNADLVPSPLSSTSTSESSRKKEVEKVETTVELRTRAVNDLEDLLRLKTEQMNKY
ncbi:hypothetical protein MMC31_004055, partial [Peltigera leucophlebia]|nr:hypothetical protein [Peltigera leucophlebia]